VQLCGRSGARPEKRAGATHGYGICVRNNDRVDRKEKLMAHIEKSIAADAPLRTVSEGAD
jgi:hypothetical protein